MVISAALRKELGLLEESIKNAEDWLSRTPIAEGKRLLIKEFTGDRDDPFVYYMTVEADGALWKSPIQVEDKENADAYLCDTRRVSDLPINERAEYASRIPELIRLIQEDEDGFPARIKDIRTEIDSVIC